MSASRLFVAIVLAAVALALFFLWPRDIERAAMLASEGRHQKAIALLQSALLTRPHDPEVLAALSRSYAALGDNRRALQTLDSYLDVRPNDVPARRRQAKLLLRTGPAYRYRDALARVTAAEPSREHVSRLLGLYRLNGDVDGEIALLQSSTSTPFLDGAALERLGALLAARGLWREAQAKLESADTKAPVENTSVRLLLLEVLLQGREYQEVYARASTWMKRSPSPFFARKVILRVAEGSAQTAVKLALAWIRIMPNETFQLVELVASEGHQEVAQRILAGWADATNNETNQDWRSFVACSARIGDIDGALRRFVKLNQQNVAAEVQASLAEEIAKQFGESVLDPLLPLLSVELLRSRPLFAAGLAIHQDNREMARWFLNQIDPARLASDDIQRWFRFLRRVNDKQEVLSSLARLWSTGHLPEELIPVFAAEAANNGLFGTHDLAWRSLRK